MEVKIGYKRYNVNIFYSKKKNSSANIKGNNINIRLSSYLPRHEKDRHYKELLGWAIRRIQKINEKKTYFACDIEDELCKEYFLPAFNRRFYVNMCDTKKISLTHSLINNNDSNDSNSYNGDDNSNIKKTIINIPMRYTKEMKLAAVKKAISKSMLCEAKEYLEKINRQHFNVVIKSFRIKDMKIRLGSYSRGNIAISLKLLFANENILRYVCVHELAHSIEGNHSKKFWNIVSNIIPEYKDTRKWMRYNL